MNMEMAEDDDGEEEIYPVNQDVGFDDIDEFFLPSDKKDLLSETGDTYTFSLLPLDQVIEDLEGNLGLHAAVKRHGTSVLRRKFGVVCSTIWWFDSMEFDFMEGFLKGVLEVVLLANDQMAISYKLSPVRRKMLRTDMKIGLFLLCHYTDALQHIIMNNSGTAPKSRGKKRNQLDDSAERLRRKAFEALQSCTDPGRNFCALWDMKDPENEFKKWMLNMVIRYCNDYYLLSHKTDEAAALVKIVGNVYMWGGISKDFWISVMVLFRKNDCGTFFAEVVNYIFDKAVDGMDALEAALSEMENSMDEIMALSAESSMGMSYANLLKGFAKNRPIAAATCLSELRELLMCNAASVRSACVQLIASAIEFQTKSPCAELDKEFVRDWWELMMNQIMDSNSNVRNKVITCVQDLTEKNYIPRKRFRMVFEKVLGRVGCSDHTPTTRRLALLCLTELLRNRPDLLKRTLADMTDDFSDCVQNLIDVLDPNSVDDFSKPWVSRQTLITLQKQLSAEAVKFVTAREIRLDVRDDVRGMDIRRIMERLVELVEVGDGATAFHYLMALASKCPDEKICTDYHLRSFLLEHWTDVSPYRILSLCDCVEAVFMKNESAASHSKAFKQLVDYYCRVKNDNLRKLAMTIVISESDMIVRRLLTECVPRLEMTLQMSIVTDITEISKFLIFADDNGFKEGVCVLRRLPGFFTSQNKDVKSAALQAYRSFFIGQGERHGHQQDVLVDKLLHEFPCISATSSGAVKLMFKDEKESLMKEVAKKLLNVAIFSDNKDDVWRACFALSILPSSADKVIVPSLQQLLKKCLDMVPCDTRLICTFCDVLIKLGRSPLEVEDPNERGFAKMILPSVSPLLLAFLDISIIGFSDEEYAGQTQMLGKITEALFAISDDPRSTLRAIVQFVLIRLKIGSALMSTSQLEDVADPLMEELESGSDTMEVPAAWKKSSATVPLQGLHYVLFFGASAAFAFANWMEDVFSISVQAKEPEERRPVGEVDDTEPDGPSEEDRGKALVVNLRSGLFRSRSDGENSGIPFIERAIYNLTLDDSIHGQTASLVAFMALIRLMLIDEYYCQRHIRPLLAVLAKTESLELRKILLIGFSDIAVRFVNLVQGFTGAFTAQLRHDDPTIRYHALMSFVRIIVNDLVKLREQQCDIAILICDPDEQVASVTKGFFKEKITEQGIMNIIPQMLAREDLHKSCHLDNLQHVMTYLVELVKKTATQVRDLVKVFFGVLEQKKPVETWRIAACCMTLIAAQIPMETIQGSIREQIFSLKNATKDNITLGFLIDAFEIMKRKLPEDKKRIADELIEKANQLSQDKAPSKGKQTNRSPTSAGGTRGKRVRQPPATRRAVRPSSSKQKPGVKNSGPPKGISAGAKKKGYSAVTSKSKRETTDSDDSSSEGESSSPPRKLPAPKSFGKQRSRKDSEEY